MGQKPETAPAGKTSRAGAVSAPTCDIQLCLCSRAGLEVSQIIHEYGVPTGSPVLYACVNSPAGFRKRHRPLERRGFWWPFPSAKPAWEGQGSCVPQYAEAGNQGAWGECEARRAGGKASVSGKSGGLDRDVWTRLQAGGSTVKFETALSQGRQICLQAGSLFYAVPSSYREVQAALCFARACWSPAPWELLSKHTGRGRMLKALFCPKELMYTKYRGFFSA